jgi:hypothetical protein
MPAALYRQEDSWYSFLLVADPNVYEFLKVSTRAEGDLTFGSLSGSSSLKSEAPLVLLLGQMNPD